MAQTLTPDICVIGAGSGGLSLAAGAAQFGLDVVLVEKGRMGGDCLNYGCVPSKALIAAAARAHAVAGASAFGVNAAAPEVDFAAVMDHVAQAIEAIAPNDSAARFTGLGVRVIAAEARFTGAREIEAGDTLIRARRFVIATGSSPLVPPITGLAGTPYLTNETVFENTERPDHLVILGGGPIGIELAQAHRRLGSRVTVLEAETPLGRDDRELAAIVLTRLEQEGINIRSGTRAVGVSHSGGRFAVRLETGDGNDQVSGTHLLIAAGRVTNVEGLGLDLAGIKHSKRGIVVDNALRTTNGRVFAIGDVAGRQQFTHVANYHAGLVLRSMLFRWSHKARDHLIPWVTYTDPELAWVGLSEDDAARRHRPIRVQRWPMAENDRAQTERETTGLVKAITTKGGRILGAGIAAHGAGELIQPWILAITQGLKIGAMTKVVLPYPTLGEAGKRAAYAYYAPLMLRSSLPRIARFMFRAF